MEVLWGTSGPAGDTEAVEFKTIRQWPGKTIVEYDPPELKPHKDFAREAGREYLGTIHSHPDDPGYCSEWDLSEARTVGCNIVAL